MSISAMKYALEILENFVEDHRCETHRLAAIHFLKEAIAEAKKQEPVAFLRKGWANWEPLYATPVDASDMSQERVDETAKDRHDFECPRCGHCCNEGVVT